MHPLEPWVRPDRDAFGKDPFGYSTLAWHKWGIAQVMAGFEFNPAREPSPADLKSPILWLAQAHALSEAATTLIRVTPDWGVMPFEIRGVCDTQYCATALMLVGYSLEVSLKAMRLLDVGVAAYTVDEKKFHHHRLQDLASVVPGLSDRDLAILEALSHFVTWAGRYPDPGNGRMSHLQGLLKAAETHRIAARDVFELSARIMRHLMVVVSKLP